MPLQWLASLHSALLKGDLNAIAKSAFAELAAATLVYPTPPTFSTIFQEISHGLVKKNVQKGQARCGFRFP